MTDELAGLPTIKRWRATGDYAYPSEECDDGEFVSYEDHCAELLRLARENADLVSQVAGWKLEASRRSTYRDRAERAEAELAALKRKIADARVVEVDSAVGEEVWLDAQDYGGKRVALVPVGGE